MVLLEKFFTKRSRTIGVIWRWRVLIVASLLPLTLQLLRALGPMKELHHPGPKTEQIFGAAIYHVGGRKARAGRPNLLMPPLMRERPLIRTAGGIFTCHLATM